MQRKIATLTVGIMVLFAPLFAGADTVHVQNNTSASASTGGNTAEGGEVVEGKAKSSVSSKTIVNGEVVEDFYEEDTDGEAQTAHEFYYENNTGSVKVESSASAGVQSNERSTRVEGESESALLGDVETPEEKNKKTLAVNIFWKFIAYVFAIFS